MTEVDATAVFMILDTDDSGTLNPGEVRAGIQSAFGSLAPSNAKIDALFRQADADRSGFIDREEFASLTKGLCQYMKINTNAFHSAITRAEFERMFERLSINDVVPREEGEALLIELCEATNAEAPPAALMKALDASKPSGQSVDLTKSDFITLLSELTQNRPSPAVSRTFRRWESEQRDKVRRTKFGYTSDENALAVSDQFTCRDMSCPSCQELTKEVGRLTALVVQGDQEQSQQTSAENAEAVELRNELASALTAKDELTVKLRERENELIQLQKELTAVRQKVEDAEQLNKSLVTANVRSSNQADSLGAKLEQMEKERIRLSRELDIASAEVRKRKTFAEFFLDMEDSLRRISTEAASQGMRARELAIEGHLSSIRDERKKLKAESTRLDARQKDVDQQRSSLEKKVQLLAKKETEFKQRQAEFEQIQFAAERTTLPEREHRMARLNSLEREVCRREALLNEREETLGYVEAVAKNAKILLQKYSESQRELKEARRAIAAAVDAIPASDF